MKAVQTGAQSLDDVIFENRNHDYGAYAVRKAYPANLNRAMTATLGLAAAILAFSFVEREVQAPIKPRLPDEGTKPKDFVILKDLPLPPVDHVRTEPVRARGDLPPVATADVVEPSEPSTYDEPYQAGTDSGIEGTAIDGFDVDYGSGDVIAADPPVVEDKIWLSPEIAASYKGGMQAMARFLSRNVKYPPVPRRMGIQGTVYVSFVVGKAGEILDATVIKGIDAACDAEALRVVNMMKEWSPGFQAGSPVKVRMVLPITFQLQ